ncbi:hypothetical protein C8Q80DRAFT_1265716 [Daedaleopsis nitida]|nr:hypothetical protein C8Q80DRAFT_1265716 [Daedaleopsis nitida]
MPVSFSDLSDEIVEKIFEHFSADGHPMSLRACTLTCHRMSFYARAVKFGSITIHCNDENGLADRFTALLKSNSAMGPLVQNLVLQKRRLPYNDDHPDHQVRPVVSQIPWHLLVNLRSITFTFVQLDGAEVFYDIMDALPSLTDITCTDVVWPNDTAIMQVQPSSGPLASRTFERLERLCIQDGDVSPATFMAGLQQRRDAVPLRSVTLHVDTDRLDDYRAWADLLRMAGATLTRASLYTREAVVGSRAAAPESGRFHEALFDGLKPCSMLRELTLIHRFRDDDSSEATGGTLFEALCDHLDSSPVPHPNLETMRLHMYDRNGAMVSVTPALAARLARALKDGSRYPAFRRLQILVTVQIWMGYWKTWMNDSSEEGFRMAEERWGRAFEAVAAAPHLKLRLEITD